MNNDPHHMYVDHSTGIAAGRATIVGSRICVWEIVESYRSGATAEMIREHYPQLTLAEIFDALGYCDDNRQEIEADIAANRRGGSGSSL